VYGWYSDNSVFLEDPGVSLRPGVYYDSGLKTPAFITETRRLFGTRRLIEVLRY